MTVVLAIAVVLLAAGLVYLLVSRREEPAEQPDFAAAVQEAASRAVADSLPGLLQANDEARKLDAKTAEAALDKRQAEIKALAERIAKGQEKIEAEVRRRGETDLQTRTLLEQMGQTVGNLNSETAGLKKALRQPQTRGQWGELQLRRCIEIAGMTEHVDFELQETLRTEDGRLRPDARFLLPEGRSFVADSKVPLDAFLDAQEAEVESERRVHLERHARQAREHVRALSSKDYQGQFKAGEMPDLVICFIPNEPALHAAFARRPRAVRLRAGAQRAAGQPDLADRAAADDGAGLAPGADGRRGGRDRRRGRHPARPLLQVPRRLRQGRQAALTSAAKSYNSAVGSMEGRLLPQLRKVEGLGIAPGKEIEPPEPVEITVREITAPELRETSDAA